MIEDRDTDSRLAELEALGIATDGDLESDPADWPDWTDLFVYTITTADVMAGI